MPPIRSVTDVAPAPLHGRAPLVVAVAERATEIDLVRARHPSGRLIGLSRRGGRTAVLVYDPSP